MGQRKGIILAGGTGSRLWPITLAVSKQLLPIYDKPMIYYPLSVLMLAGIRDIAIITTPHDQDQFQRLLSDGSQFGVSFTYIIQPMPEGLAQAYLLAERFLAGAPSAMVLGDNIFFGHGLPRLLKEVSSSGRATVFGYRVTDPHRYGVADIADDGKVHAIVEKPSNPPTNIAVTGLYFLDQRASQFAREITPSSRGELEITDLLSRYIHEGTLDLARLGRGYAWLDTGTYTSLLDAGNFVRTLEERQGLQMGCPEEIAYQKGWISQASLSKRVALLKNSPYGRYLSQLARSRD
jgi:glucose-1-phosphate thymidylyltransferase